MEKVRLRRQWHTPADLSRIGTVCFTAFVRHLHAVTCLHVVLTRYRLEEFS
jgi:hypothetical protein